MTIFVLCIGLGAIVVFFIHDSLIQFQLIQFIITFNSCVNFFIYCTFRKGFRETLLFPKFLVNFCTKKARAGTIISSHGHSCDSQRVIVGSDYDHTDSAPGSADHEKLHISRLNHRLLFWIRRKYYEVTEIH